MHLTSIVEQLAEQRDIDHITEMQYRRSVKCFSEFLGRPALAADLNEGHVNRWLRSLRGAKADATILGRKRGMTAVWNFAAEAGIVEHYNPRKLRQCKVAFAPVVPWSTTQLRILMTAAAEIPGYLQIGIRASDYLPAYVRFGFETGLRPSDLRLVEWDQVDLEARTVAVSQHKTGYGHVAQFSVSTAQLLSVILTPERKRVFPLTKSAMRRWERMLFEHAATLGFTRRKGQALGYSRKSHGTEVARTQGLEAAARSLGHVSGTQTARRYYVAPDAIGRRPDIPELDDAQTPNSHRTRASESNRNRRSADRRRTGSGGDQRVA